jgi:ABC-2 type transport system ATP-binding protein
MLQISNLCKTYANGVQALRDVNLTIGTGMFGLLGPNGAGKSSLMRTLATLQDSDSGTIRFDGIDVAADPAFLRARLGYLPQDFGVYPKIPAFDLLNHMAVLKGMTDRSQREEQVNALLHQTNLYDSRKRAVGSFSGGMRQRFGIAQALLGDPRLIIVDEPTAGLDPEERNRFHNLLSEIGETVVVLLSTHIVDDVLDLCPRMAIMAAGTVRQQGAPLDLIAQLDGQVWQCFIERADLAACASRHTLISARLLAGRTCIRVLSATSPQTGFTAVQADLEDVYFAVLKGVFGSGAAA